MAGKRIKYDERSRVLEHMALAAFPEVTEIEIGTNVKQISDCAFTGCSHLERIIIHGIIPKIGKNSIPEEDVKHIVIEAPKMPLFSFPQGILGCAARGFASIVDEIEIDPLVYEENIKTIKSKKKQLYDFAIYDIKLLDLMIKVKAISKKDFPVLLEKAQVNDCKEVIAMLLDYTSETKTQVNFATDFNL